MGQSALKSAKASPENNGIGDSSANVSELDFIDGDIHDKLFVACSRNMSINIIKKLLKQGARIDNPIGAKTGQTACHVCQDSNKFKLLCKARGVDDCDEIIDADGNTPLHIAAKTDNLDLVLTLVEHGCTPDKLNNSSRTPVDIAKTFMNDEVYLVLQQLESKVCFCKQKAESMLRAFCEEYPYFACVLDYRAKVQTNIDLIKISREREKNEESSSGFTFEALQKKKRTLTTEDQDALLKREKEEEDEIMKTMHASDVDGLVDLTDIKEQIKMRQLALHYRKGEKCRHRRIKCDRCDRITTIDALERHYLDECLDASVPCPEGCGKRFAKSQVEFHRVKCPNRTHYPCPLGCGKVLTRKYDE